MTIHGLKSFDYIIDNYRLKSEDIDHVAIVGSRLEETSGGSLVKIHKKFGLKITPVIKIISPIVNFFDNFLNS